MGGRTLHPGCTWGLWLTPYTSRWNGMDAHADRKKARQGMLGEMQGQGESRAPGPHIHRQNPDHRH